MKRFVGPHNVEKTFGGLNVRPPTSPAKKNSFLCSQVYEDRSNAQVVEGRTVPRGPRCTDG
jgi:hypothetical protein